MFSETVQPVSPGALPQLQVPGRGGGTNETRHTENTYHPQVTAFVRIIVPYYTFVSYKLLLLKYLSVDVEVF